MTRHMQGFAGAPGHGLFNEEAGYCPTASLVNKMVFAAKAGDACIFDIATCVRVKPEQSSPAPHALCCCFATTRQSGSIELMCGALA
jgi:hypothetical protein